MQRRDMITVAGISVIALVGALLIGPMLRGSTGDGPDPLPPPRTAVLPDPVLPASIPPLLTVSVVDAESGTSVENDSQVLLFSGTDPNPVAGMRGARARTPLVLAKAPVGTSLQLHVRRERYLMPAPVEVTLAQGETRVLEVKLQPLHRVTLWPEGGGKATLMGVVRVWPLPQWPQDQPLVRWATPARDGFPFELPTGRYVACVPTRDLTRDLQGRPWLNPKALADSPAYAVPCPCLRGEFEVTRQTMVDTPHLTAHFKVPVSEVTGGHTVSGTLTARDGLPQRDARVELVRLGPIRTVVADALVDAEGRFSFAGLAPAFYQARVRGLAGQWPWVESAPSATVALRMPPATAPPETPGKLVVQLMDKGEPAFRGQVLLLGRYESGVFHPGNPVDTVGEPTGFRGLVNWEGVTPGRYRISALPATGATLEVDVRPGQTTEVVFESEPPGSGSMRVTGDFAKDAWLILEDESGKVVCATGPESFGDMQARGLPPGTLTCTLYERDDPPVEFTVQILPDRTTLQARPAKADKPQTPEPPKEEPAPPAPQEPKEEPKEEPREEPKPESEPPKDEGNPKPGAAHDRPIGGASLKLPAPAETPKPPTEPAAPRQEPIKPKPMPERPSMPVQAPEPAGPVLRIVLELDPAAPELWQAVMVIGPTQATLFDTLTTDKGSIWLGLCLHEGRPTITMRGHIADLRDVTLHLPGHQPLQVAIPQAAQEVQAKPQKR